MSTTDDNNDQCDGDSEEITSSNKECTSCEQNNVDNISEGIDIVAMVDTSTCANCGKEGISDNMNICNKCKSVKYCNAACKKKHRTKHKKACEKRVAELHEEQLFKEIEPEECPLCLVPFINGNKTESFKSCCGKIICNGCIHAMKMSEGKDLCAFCRTPPSSSDEEDLSRVRQLMDKGNGEAFCLLAGLYSRGRMGIPQDYQKANELYLRAGELGCDEAYYNLGHSYHTGTGVEVDKKKAKHYYELAAMNGNMNARHNLGAVEAMARNNERAMRHCIIAARAGHEKGLDGVKIGYNQGIVTKDEYATTLRAYHERQKEMKSDARGKAETLGTFS